MVRQQQPGHTGGGRLHAGVEQLGGQAVVPQAGRHGGQHHQAHGHERAQGLKPRYQVDHDQHQKALLPQPAAAADCAQEHRVKTLQHQAPVQGRQQQHAGTGDAGHQQQARPIHAQRTAKQNVQQVVLGAVARDQRHAQRQGYQVDGGQAGIFLERGEPRDQPG